jgi:predicted ATPase
LGRSIHFDVKTCALCWEANTAWILGYPEQAGKWINAAHDHGRRVGLPNDLGWALTIGAMVFDHLGEHEEHLNGAAEVARLGREHRLPFLTEGYAPIGSGIALIRKGQTAEGVPLLEKGLALWEAGVGPTGSPYMRTVLAAGVAQQGNLDGALHLIDAVIAEIEGPDRQERHAYAEALRIKGWLLALKDDAAGAECSYIASLDWARTQQAKSWELRTATSYARLMRDQGRAREAHDLLTPVYAWFTEGFATKGLKEAKALLDELGDRLGAGAERSRPAGRFASAN